MKKKLLGMVMSMALIISALAAVPMTAQADTMMVVTVGADLTEDQKNMILNYFNVSGQSYTTITVTNDDEWSHLGSYMSRDIVGYRTISCALIRPMTSGGIQVKTANLTYVTSNMIASNLATAGVTNCEVIAAAPFQVSGTGALTGALMAYENLSGVTLDDSKKEAAAQEFATTYELGQTVGQQEAQQIVNDVKMQVINGNLVEDNSVTDEEITQIVNNVVNNYTENNTTVNNTGLTAEDIEALNDLALTIAQESYEQGTIDALAQIQETLEGQTQTASTAATTQIEDTASSTADTGEAAQSTDSSDSSSSDGGTTLSAADQALSSDSILTDTNDSALAGTSEDGTVITSSTAESTIDTTTSTNLDTQIEEEQAAASSEAQSASSTDSSAQASAIPEASGSAVIVTDDTAATTDGGQTQESSTETVTEAAAEAQEPAAEASEPVQASLLQEAPITADDVKAGNAQLVSYSVSVAADGTTAAQASGSSTIALVLPYNNLVPVSNGSSNGFLRITNSSGAEVTTVNITNPAVDLTQQNVLIVAQDETITLPDGWDGYTKILVNADGFTPAAGEKYTYTLEAQLAQVSDPAASTDGAPLLNVTIDNYTPYTEPVSAYGFSLSDYNFSAPSVSGGATATGSVIFPEGTEASYATVSADGLSGASVYNAADGSSTVYPGSTTVAVTPVKAGKVTLTINYYAAAAVATDETEPDGAYDEAADTAGAAEDSLVATVSYSIQFTA